MTSGAINLTIQAILCRGRDNGRKLVPDSSGMFNTFIQMVHLNILLVLRQLPPTALFNHRFYGALAFATKTSVKHGFIVVRKQISCVNPLQKARLKRAQLSVPAAFPAILTSGLVLKRY